MFNTKQLVQTALFSAIIFLLAFTPLGYLRIWTIEVTLLTIPVVVGAILLGPKIGAFLGFIFGLTSFIQCFGLSPFGTALLAIDPYLTAILCFVPRILMGYLVGVLFQVLRKHSNEWLALVSSSLAGSLLNTVLFVGTLVVFFGQSDFLRQFGETPWAIITVLVTFNALAEAILSLIIGSTVAKALSVYLKKAAV